MRWQNKTESHVGKGLLNVSQNKESFTAIVDVCKHPYPSLSVLVITCPDGKGQLILSAESKGILTPLAYGPYENVGVQSNRTAYSLPNIKF